VIVREPEQLGIFDVKTPILDEKPLILRSYQEEALNKILWAQQLPGNDLCVLPTGAGKSVVIASLAKKLNTPILILQPSKEILEQNYNKLCRFVDRSQVGIYSASMNEKTINFYTFATIQSIYQKPEEFKHFKIVIIDECHLVNPKNLGGMFTSFLKAIGAPKVVGFTATPYRMGVTYIKNPQLFDPNDLTPNEAVSRYDLTAVASIKLINRMKEMFWNRIIYNINNAELLEGRIFSPFGIH
jgi:superfamily II DNA or RNA helicase